MAQVIGRSRRGADLKRGSFRDQPERPREHYYDEPESTGFFGKVRKLIGRFGRKSPQERVRDEPQDQRDRHRSRLRPAVSREWDEQWLEETRARPNGICGANATVMRHDGIQRTNRRNRGLMAMPIGVCGGEQIRLRRERGMKIVSQTGRIATANATAKRLGHATSAMRKSLGGISAKTRASAQKAAPSRIESRMKTELEDSNVAGEHYRERYRNPPRRAPEPEPETSSWQRFPEQEIDRYFVEPSPEADGEAEDAERSNFDHEPDRAPRRRLSLEPEETFETIPPEGHYIRERRPVSHRYESERENRIETKR